jgi:predicted nucleotidyltransferase
MPANADTMKRFLLRREADEKAACERRASRVLEHLRDCLPRLAEAHPSITRVTVFGSLVQGRFGPSSDVDMLVEGLNTEEYWEVRREVVAFAEREVDLYMETDDSDILDEIRRQGLVLYERKG